LIYILPDATTIFGGMEYHQLLLYLEIWQTIRTMRYLFNSSQNK